MPSLLRDKVKWCLEVRLHVVSSSRSSAFKTIPSSLFARPTLIQCGVHNLGELTYLVGCVGECKGWKILSRRNQPGPGCTWIIGGGITRGRNRRHRLSGRSSSSFRHCWICRDSVYLEFTQFSTIAFKPLTDKRNN